MNESPPATARCCCRHRRRAGVRRVESGARAGVANARRSVAQRARRRRRRKNRQEARQRTSIPNATRQEPEAKASAKVTPKLQKMKKLYDDDKGAEAA